MDPSLSGFSEQLLLQHGPFVQQLARGLLGDEHLAQDVVQESWLRWRQQPPREARAARSWFAKVARRLSVDHLREHSRRQEREYYSARSEAVPDASRELERTEVLRTVVEAVLALDDPYKTTLLLCYWRGWNAERIAKETGTSLATVRSRLQRAHLRVRERLEREHEREHWLTALGAMAQGPASEGLALVTAVTSTKVLCGVIAVVLLAVLGWQKFHAPDTEGYLTRNVQSAALPAPAAEDAGVGELTPSRSQASASTPKSSEALVIAGTVVNRAYAALALAETTANELELKIAIVSTQADQGVLDERSVRTDDQGKFSLSFADVGAGPLQIDLRAAGNERYRDLHYTQEALAREVEISVERVAHGLLLGRAVDEQGQGLAAARLWFESRDERCETTTAADGSFVLAGNQPVRNLAAQCAGHELLQWSRPIALASGGYEPWEVRFASRAQLELRIEDVAGQGLAGWSARVELHESECQVLDLDAGAELQSRSSMCADNGSVFFPDLWAGRRLRIVLSKDAQEYRCDARQGERLLLDPAGREQAQMLVLQSGADNLLRAVMMVDLELAGEVRLRDGEPAPAAALELFDLGASTDPMQAAPLLRFQADESGQFHQRLRSAYLRGPLLLRGALGSPQSEISNGGLGHRSPNGTEHSSAVGELLIEDPELGRQQALKLWLEPTLPLAGSLRAADGALLSGKNLRSRIWLVPSGQAFAQRQLPAKQPKRDGSFRFEGVPAGNYDLFVSEEGEAFYSYENFLHRFPNCPAGSENLNLRLPRQAAVQIRLRTMDGSTPPGIVLHRRLFSLTELAQHDLHATRKLKISEYSGWPRGTVFSFAGISSSRDDLGSYSDGYDALQWSPAGQHELAALQPGWYQIGMHARDAANSRSFYPQATRLTYFEAGEYELEFSLLPSASQRGQLRGAKNAAILAVQLVDGTGHAQSFAASGSSLHAVDSLELNARGEFVLKYAPCGRFSLRVGTQAQLQRGEYLCQREVELTPGDNAPVLIQL